MAPYRKNFAYNHTSQGPFRLGGNTMAPYRKGNYDGTMYKQTCQGYDPLGWGEGNINAPYRKNIGRISHITILLRGTTL